jgi:hypothetical protein
LSSRKGGGQCTLSVLPRSAAPLLYVAVPHRRTPLPPPPLVGCCVD